MEISPDVWFVLTAVIITVLTALLTTRFFYNQSDPANSHKIIKSSINQDFSAPCNQENSTKKSLPEHGELQPESSCTRQRTKDDPSDSHTSKQWDNVDDEGVSDFDNPTDCVKTNCEDTPLRYMPGMLRTSQLEKMMSKEELEEEQRVQREQLAAIFNLLKQNQPTFGEVTETDMEEQLKLYSI